MQRRSMILLAVLAVASVGCSSSGAPSVTASTASGTGGTAATPRTIRFSTNFPLPPYVYGVLLDDAVTKLQRDSGDALRVTTYPSNQLYSDAEAIQVLSSGGSLEMAAMSPAALSAAVPVAAVFGMPYLFRTYVPQLYTKLSGADTPLGKELERQAEAKGMVVVGGELPNARMIFSKVSIPAPEQLKGLTVRQGGSDPISVASAKAFGYTSAAVAVAETGTALRQGVVQAVWGSPQFMATFIDAGKYVVDPGGLSPSGELVVANKKWWDALPSSLQGVIRSAFVQMDLETFDLDNKDRAKAIGQLKAAGKVFETWSPAAIQQAEKLTDPLYDQYRDQFGSSVIDFIKKQRASLSSQP